MEKELNHFKCAVHPLDTIAKDCDKLIRDTHEKDLQKPNQLFTSRGDSVTLTLVKGVSKLWFNDKFGTRQELEAHMKSKFPDESSFCNRYVGNRFHIYFRSAGLIYAYRHEYTDFLDNILGKKDGLQGAIASVLRNAQYNIALRCLGIMGKRCTGPWLKRTENPNLSILDANTIYQEAVQSLEAWSKNAAPMLHGDATIFPSVTVQEDLVWQRLLEETDSESLSQTVTLLQQLCTASLDVIKRQCADQLEAGRFGNHQMTCKVESKA